MDRTRIVIVLGTVGVPAASSNSSKAQTRSKELSVRTTAKVKKLKADIALHGNPVSELRIYGTSLAIWDHTVLPATRHKITRPA